MKDNKEIDESIKDVLNTLYSRFNKDAEKNYEAVADQQQIKEAVAALKNNRPQDFYDKLIMPFNMMVHGLLEVHLPNPEDKYANNGLFLYEESSFIRNHFTRVITITEGNDYSVDKVNCIMNALARWFSSGEVIAWNYNQEYTYHLPRKVFTDHDGIILFYEALRDLYFGCNGNYIMEFAKLLDRYPRSKGKVQREFQ